MISDLYLPVTHDSTYEICFDWKHVLMQVSDEELDEALDKEQAHNLRS